VGSNPTPAAQRSESVPFTLEITWLEPVVPAALFTGALLLMAVPTFRARFSR
jgi:hypothetical protein